MTSRVREGKEAAGAKFSDYFDFGEPLAKLPSHRILALFRGEKEEILDLKLEPEEGGEAQRQGPGTYEQRIAHRFGIADHGRAGDRWLLETVRWAWRTKILVHLGIDLRMRLWQAAEEEAVRVFAMNLRDLLLATAAGIVASFLVLAGGAVALKAAGASVGWGIQFQEPVFLAAMAVIVTLFGANMLGLFEVVLPGRAMDAAARASGAGRPEQDGLTAPFLTGAFATLLATPCSAPFVGTALGFALSRGPLEIGAIFAALGLGMALPYLLIAAVPGLARLLPRPGRWMAWVKAVLGLALFGTAAWLLTVLAVQVPPEAAAVVAGALAAIRAGAVAAPARAASRSGAPAPRPPSFWRWRRCCCRCALTVRRGDGAGGLGHPLDPVRPVPPSPGWCARARWCSSTSPPTGA